MKAKVIAIDGPSGSGKSTIAKIVAKKLGLTYLDTGAMFRAIGLFLHDKNISKDNISQISKELVELDFKYALSDSNLVQINGENLTDKIREHHVSQIASQYSQLEVVREYLKELQRSIAGARASILEGRDIGTVIFPDAALKFFLTADPLIRAERRLAQIKEKEPDTNLTAELIHADIVNRDKTDQNRAIAPLVKAEDAIEVDTTSMSIDDVCGLIYESFRSSSHMF